MITILFVISVVVTFILFIVDIQRVNYLDGRFSRNKDPFLFRGSNLYFLLGISLFCMIGSGAGMVKFLIDIPQHTQELIRLDKEKEITILANSQSVTRITPILREYPQFEKDMFLSLKPEDLVFLATRYPELKSNTFFMKKADLIQNNITREKEIDIKKIGVEKSIGIRKFYIFF